MISAFGSLSRLGDAGAAGASRPMDGYYIDTDGVYWYHYAGGTITIVRQPGVAANVAIQVVPGSSQYAAIYAQIAANPSHYKGINPPIPTGSSGKPVAAAQSATANTGVEGSTQLNAGATQVQTGDGRPAWLQTVTDLSASILPFVALGVDQISQGGGNTLAKLNAQLASKRVALSKATSASARARLTTEIQALQQQIASYQSMSSATGQESYVTDTAGMVSKSAVPWTALLVVGVPVAAGLIWWASTSGSKTATA